MHLFESKTTVYGPEDITVGEVDYSVDGFYRNVVTIPIDVKPKHMLTVRMTSDKPVDIVVAREDGSAVAHKEGVTDITMGPYPTEKHDSMGVILGVFRGDLAHVKIEAWIERK